MVYTELYHHGIIGQKWGVRRYQNYDGSLTKAGMKRYNTSLEKYEKAAERYSNAKKNKASETELTNARLEKKKAQAKLNKDYKHLKQDKLADQGKELYSKGYTITGNAATTKTLASIGSTALLGSYYLKDQGIIGKDAADAIMIGGLGTMGIATIYGLTNKNKDKKLRAYYSHTSNY